GSESRDLAIRGVDDDPLAVAEPVDGLPLPPRQDRLAVERLSLEVGHDLAVRRGVEPDELAGAVEDHRATLPRTGRRREEDEPRRGPPTVPKHRDDRRLEVRPRGEVLHVRAWCSRLRVEDVDGGPERRGGQDQSGSARQKVTATQVISAAVQPAQGTASRGAR